MQGRKLSLPVDTRSSMPNCSYKSIFLYLYALALHTARFRHIFAPRILPCTSASEASCAIRTLLFLFIVASASHGHLDGIFQLWLQLPRFGKAQGRLAASSLFKITFGQEEMDVCFVRRGSAKRLQQCDRFLDCQHVLCNTDCWRRTSIRCNATKTRIRL
jgi:hypothetical protein